METKTACEWYQDVESVILDYDGFGKNFKEKWDTEQMTKEEFDRRLSLCTTISYVKS